MKMDQIRNANGIATNEVNIQFVPKNNSQQSTYVYPSFLYIF